MLKEEWSIIAKVPTFAEAEVVKLLLETEDVETVIQKIDSINPKSGFNIVVESDLVHRAAWILKNKGITAAELNFLATGELREENWNEKHDD